MIERGLIVDEPWISKILNGTKTWEMRSKPTKVRGTIALIRKGSGHVFGVVKLVGNGPVLDSSNYSSHLDKHGIGPDRQSGALAGGWVHPWIIKDVRVLSRPVRYTHKSGAVIFVKLDAAVSNAIEAQTE